MILCIVPNPIYIMFSPYYKQVAWTERSMIHVPGSTGRTEQVSSHYTEWNEMEKIYFKTKIWHTCTPYFDERNVHFYVNKCHFHIVEFFNKYHPDPNMSEDFIGDAGEGMFEFEKVIK